MLASAEGQMIALLPDLAAGTDTEELTHALLAQVESCKAQLSLLEEILASKSAESNVSVSRGIESLLGECTDLLQSFPVGNLRDAVMIAHMQRAEHYKMAAYASVHEYAKLLGDKEMAARLAQAGKAVTNTSRTLGAIAIQVDAEAYVDTRVEGT